MSHLILLLSVFMLSTAPVIVKFVSIPPLSILFWRLLFVSIMLFPFAFKEIKTLKKDDFKSIALASGILFFHFLSWFSGVQKTPVSVTSVTFASNPIFTAIIGFVVLRETFRKRYIIAIISSILGIYVTFYSGESGSVTIQGIIEVLIAAFLYSAYMVYSKKNRGSLNNGVYTFYLNLFTGILGALAISITSLFSDIQILPSNNTEWIALACMAFLPSVLGHTLMIYSLPKYNLNFVSCLKLLSPLSASLMAVYFFNEQLNEKFVTGFMLVSTGVLFALPWARMKFIRGKDKDILQE